MKSLQIINAQIINGFMKPAQGLANLFAIFGRSGVELGIIIDNGVKKNIIEIAGIIDGISKINPKIEQISSLCSDDLSKIEITIITSRNSRLYQTYRFYFDNKSNLINFKELLHSMESFSILDSELSNPKVYELNRMTFIMSTTICKHIKVDHKELFNFVN